MAEKHKISKAQNPLPETIKVDANGNPLPQQCQPKQQATKEQMEDRVQSVFQSVLAGMSNYSIIKAAMKEWDVSERQSYNYLAEANKKLLEVRNRDFNKVYGFHVNAAKKLYAKAISNKDYDLALHSLQHLAKIDGVLVDRVIIDDKREGELVEEARKLLKAEDADFEEIDGRSDYGS